MKKIFLSTIMVYFMALFSTPCTADSDYAVTMLPLRKTLEKRGMSVQWSEPNNINVKKGEYEFSLKTDSDIITVDEGEFYMKQSAKLIDGVTYVSDDITVLLENLYLYHNAIIDSTLAEESERMLLKAIDTSQEKVLVCTWNRYPNTYITGSEITLEYGDVWVFTVDEAKDWGKKNGMAEDMTLRMEQLIGLPPQKGNTHFSLLWVNPSDLYRPSPDNEIDDDKAELDFPDNATEEYKKWFNDNITASYYPHKYPWTRLGYTYDWADNGTEYGLSEFIIKGGAKVMVEKTYSNDEFFKYITE